VIRLHLLIFGGRTGRILGLQILRSQEQAPARRETRSRIENSRFDHHGSANDGSWPIPEIGNYFNGSGGSLVQMSRTVCHLPPFLRHVAKKWPDHTVAPAASLTFATPESQPMSPETSTM
jgi:hypothetical protein